MSVIVGEGDDLVDLCHRIDELGDRVGALWHAAAAAGDFVELERCTSAGQALRRAPSRSATTRG